MENNIDILKIEWFGGFNKKKNRYNKGGVGRSLFCDESSWISIYEFKDDTKYISSSDYSSLVGKFIFLYKGDKYLINENFSFHCVNNEELLFLLDKCIRNKKIDRKIIENIVRIVINRNLDILNVSKKILLESRYEFNFSTYQLNWLDNIDFINYFFKKEDYYTLILAEEFINSMGFILIDFENEGEKWKKILCRLKEKKELQKSIQYFEEFSETIKIFKNINKPWYVNTKILYEDTELKTDLIKINGDLPEIIEYIKLKLKFKNHIDIKIFLNYIENYSCAIELENYFFKEIIDFIRKEVEYTISIKKILKYFDGTIVFSTDRNNEEFDKLRVEVLNKNEELKKLIDEFLLYLPEEQSMYRCIHINKNQKICYNREYYSQSHAHYYNFSIDEIMPNYINDVYKFKNGERTREAIFFFAKGIEFLKLKQMYSYSLVNVPSTEFSKSIVRFNVLIKFVSLLTGIKNAFNYIFIPSGENLISRKTGGDGIIGKCDSKPIKTRYAIIIDDIITRGNTLNYCKDTLKSKNVNLEVKANFFMARTYEKINPQEFFKFKKNDKLKLLEICINYRYASIKESYFYIIDEDLFNNIEDIKRHSYTLVPEKYRYYGNYYLFRLYSNSKEPAEEWRYSGRL